MTQRLRKLPGDGDADWEGLAGLKFLMLETPEGRLVVYRPLERASRETLALLRLKVALVYTNAWLDDCLEKSTDSESPIIKPDPQTIKNYREFTRQLAMSDALFHTAYEAQDDDESFNQILPWGLIAGLIWRGQWGDIRRAAESAARHLAFAGVASTSANESIGTVSDAYSAVAQDLSMRAKATFPALVDSALLGQRGGAFGDEAATRRGLLIRDLNRLLPPFETARYAAIASILTAIGVDRITPALVRSTILRGRT